MINQLRGRKHKSTNLIAGIVASLIFFRKGDYNQRQLVMFVFSRLLIAVPDYLVKKEKMPNIRYLKYAHH
jgi:hypothetical protein